MPSLLSSAAWLMDASRESSGSDATPPSDIETVSDGTPSEDEDKPMQQRSKNEDLWDDGTSETIAELRQQLDMMNTDEKVAMIFNMMMEFRRGEGHLKPMLFGRPVTALTFMKSLGMGSTRYYRLQHHILLGHTSPPHDGRHDRERDAPARSDVLSVLSEHVNHVSTNTAKAKPLANRFLPMV